MTKNEEMGEMAVIALLCVLVAPFEYMLYGFSSMHVWNVLLVKTLSQLNVLIPIVTFAQAFCLYCVFSFFCKKSWTDIYKMELHKGKVYTHLFIYSWAQPLLIVLLVYVIEFLFIK